MQQNTNQHMYIINTMLYVNYILIFLMERKEKIRKYSVPWKNNLFKRSKPKKKEKRNKRSKPEPSFPEPNSQILKLGANFQK